LVLGATDAFLFAVVLLIFASLITFGFTLDFSQRSRERLPNWMQVTSHRALMRNLVEVIVLPTSQPHERPLWNTFDHACVRSVDCRSAATSVIVTLTAFCCGG
jgi:Uncharacterized protein family, UPF0114